MEAMEIMEIIEATEATLTKKKLNIFIPCKPIPWKAPILCRGIFVSPRYRDKKRVKALIYKEINKLDENEKVYFKEGKFLRCDFKFLFLPPKSVSKKNRALMLSGAIRPTFWGDYVNLRKFFEDCLEGIVFDNDRQIVEGFGTKFYDGEREGVEVILHEA